MTPDRCMACAHCVPFRNYYACRLAALQVSFKDTCLRRPEWCPLDKKLTQVKKFRVSTA